MYYSIRNKLKKIFHNKIVKNIILICITFFLFMIFYQLEKLDLSEGWLFVIEIAKDICSFSVVVTLVKDLFSLFSDWFTEENKKISSNHHKIIIQYTDKNLGHEVYKKDHDGNYFSEEGSIMQLRNLDHNFEKRLKPSNDVKYSKGQNDEIKEINNFLKTSENPVLNLPTLNIFTNNVGKVDIEVNDSEEMFEMNDLIINNVGEILDAHKHSKTSNNETIRLNNLSMKGNKLFFDLQRTNYYQMLLTNRAMDYEFQGMTLRELYESGKKITPLKDSCFGNQLGINGVVITSDGYLLIEHRSRRKTTWKDKYGQPISLSMKVGDFFTSKNEVKTLNSENFKEKFENCLLKTIKSNFNLTKSDCKSISFDNNFMGVARDLLEGGKPNIYFFVELKLTAKEATKVIQERAAVTSNLKLKFEDGATEEIKPLGIDKVKGKWFFVKYDDMKFNYQYRMVINKHKQIVYKIKMKRYPRYKWIFTNKNETVSRLNKHNKVYSDFAEFKAKNVRDIKVSKKKLKLSKYTGEALLVCMSYLAILKDRISSLNVEKENM